MRKSSSFVENQGSLVTKRTPKQNHNPKHVAALQQTEPRYKPLGQSFVNGVIRPGAVQDDLQRMAIQQRNAKKSLP